MAIITYRTTDHPEASGRKPLNGEQQWTLSFPLENGDDYLEVKVGRRGFNGLLRMLDEYRLNDEKEIKPS